MNKHKFKNKVNFPSHINIVKFDEKSEKITLRCKTHQVKWDIVSYRTIIPVCKNRQYTGCTKCRIESDRLTNEQFDKKARLKQKNLVRLDNYVKSRHRIRINCLTCGHIWSPQPYTLIHNNSHCPKCSNHIRITRQQVVERIEHRTVELVGKMNGIARRCKWKCKKCNHRWKTTPSHIISSKSGCPRCNLKMTKKNEILTGKYLKELLPGTTIKPQFYIKEKIYENNVLIKNYLYVDFEFKLPMGNGEKQFFIEFNGGQHFRAVRKWGGKNALYKQKIRDKFLRKYCKTNKIRLIEIDGRKIRGPRILSELRKRLRSALNKKAPKK
jgi:Zn finger protein HypA/HybF involved in hydrogenase expression